jgi:hypothetical protein
VVTPGSQLLKPGRSDRVSGSAGAVGVKKCGQDSASRLDGPRRVRRVASFCGLAFEESRAGVGAGDEARLAAELATDRAVSRLSARAPARDLHDESLHLTLRKIIKNRGSFPSDESATKLLYLALRNVARRWKRPRGNGGTHSTTSRFASETVSRSPAFDGMQLTRIAPYTKSETPPPGPIPEQAQVNGRRIQTRSLFRRSRP